MNGNNGVEQVYTLNDLLNANRTTEAGRQQIAHHIQNTHVEDDPPVLFAWKLERLVSGIVSINDWTGAPPQPFSPPLPFPCSETDLKHAILSTLRAQGAPPPLADFCLPCTSAQVATVGGKAMAMAHHPWWRWIDNRLEDMNFNHSCAPLAFIYVFQSNSDTLSRCLDEDPEFPAINLWN